ncbi:MAG: hypothetical protein V1691_00810 [Chloroflexota bacterium]
MVDWQITATTIYCDAVDDDVTLVVHKDWSAECVGYRKRYCQPDRELARLLAKKGQKLGRKLACEGPQCRRIAQYRDRLSAEEGAALGGTVGE